MAATRSLLVVLGFGIAVGGLLIAWAVDRTVGMAMLIVGALVAILPFTAATDEE